MITGNTWSYIGMKVLGMNIWKAIGVLLYAGSLIQFDPSIAVELST